MTMNNFKEMIKDEFLSDSIPMDWIILASGICLQIFAIIAGHLGETNDNFGTILVGITGTVYMVLVIRGKSSSYIFGLVYQLFYAVFYAWMNGLNGGMLKSILFSALMMYGIYLILASKRDMLISYWSHDKEYTSVGNSLVAGLTFDCIVLFYWILRLSAMFGNKDLHPFLDSLTLVTAYTAQMLMILGHKEHWIYWAICNIFNIILASKLKCTVIAAQYGFWIVCCVYGFVRWYILEQQDN